MKFVFDKLQPSGAWRRGTEDGMMQGFDLQLPLDVINVCQQLQDNESIQMHAVNAHGDQLLLAAKKLAGTHWVNISFDGKPAAPSPFTELDF